MSILVLLLYPSGFFPCQQYGETQRVGSRTRNSVYSYEMTDIQFTLEFSVFAFFF